MRHDGHEEITIKVGELDQLNKLLLELININDFVKKVQDRVVEVVENDPLEYIDEEGFVDLGEENLIDQAVEHIFENEVNETYDVPTILYEETHERFDNDLWEGLSDTVKEVYRDSVEYNRDPLGYHGMKQSDFL